VDAGNAEKQANSDEAKPHAMLPTPTFLLTPFVWVAMLAHSANRLLALATFQIEEKRQAFQVILLTVPQ
jgi:hypothetical protein